MTHYAQRVAVLMDDGKTWETSIDQRDLAAWEVSPLFAETGRTYTMVRYTAWTSSMRNGHTTLKWGPFNAALVSAHDPEGVDDEDQAGEVDPTRPGQPAGS